MRHVFKATKLGWDEEKEGVWFDSDYYTKEEAEEQFVPYVDKSPISGFIYTAYKFGGQRYHDYEYLGEFEDDDMPQNDTELKEKRK